ncbi:MAG TPA: CBS domain-containing protein [Nitrospiria bacterium]|nr:CBS domain-containing protein [Nitrospiria bacterium]
MRPVKEIMATNVQWVKPGTMVRAAAGVMARERIGSVLVGDGSSAIGMVSETDVVRRVLADDRDPTSVTVDEIMSGPVVTVEGHRPIEHAGDLMAEHEIRHVGVTVGGKVAGMVSVRDLLPVVNLLPITVERMMTRMPVLVPTLETVRNAAALMAHACVSGLLVSGERLRPRGIHFRGFTRADIAGIVTGTDLVRDVIDKDLDPYVTPVSAVMGGPLYTLERTESLATAFDVMARGKVRHLGVTSGGEGVTGLLSVEDVIEPAWLHVASGARRKSKG